MIATLDVSGEGVALAFVPDPEARAPAMARALGYAITHVGTDPPESLRRHFSSLTRALASLGDAPAPESDALPRIARACRSAIPGARLIVRRRFPADQRAPLWPATLRSGAPREPGHDLWPYDAELAGLLIGRRKLLLRESLTLADAESDAAWLASHGVATRIVGTASSRRSEDSDRVPGGAKGAEPATTSDANAKEDDAAPPPSASSGGTQRVYASLDRSILEDAPAIHQDACRVHDGWAGAARFMGDALGYPRCCVETFSRARKRDDVTMFLDLLPPLPHPPAPPYSLWLDGALALISHAPCSLECPATLDLATSVLAELDRQTPGFASRWRALAARVHAMTAEGRVFAIAAEGDLAKTGVLRVLEAVELRPPTSGDLSTILAPFEPLTGADLHLDRGYLTAPGFPDWTAALVADHRGPLT